MQSQLGHIDADDEKDQTARQKKLSIGANRACEGCQRVSKHHATKGMGSATVCRRAASSPSTYDLCIKKK